ncbi:MAG: TAXI family TRAP transporter solute-binding subunit [Amphritea sp.]
MKYWLQQFTCFVLFGCLTVLSVSAENRIVSLGTGGITGLYYPTGGALCRLVNLTRQNHGIRCAVHSTLGSITNLEQVASGDFDLGIAEAGQLYRAVKKEGSFSDSSLRTLASLFPESLSVLVRSDSGIHTFDDLLNKRINIGKAGSSQRFTLDLLMAARGWQLDDFAEVVMLEPAEQATALCEDRIDATLYVVGHPSGAIKEAIRDCSSQLISLSARDITALIQQNPHYLQVSIAGGFYSAELPDVVTAGVNATLFTRADLPDEVAYAIVKSLFEQFERFRQMHPAFSLLQPEQMVSAPLAAPLHPGAARYYRESGLMQLVSP